MPILPGVTGRIRSQRLVVPPGKGELDRRAEEVES
jgi:hypothetical protein